MASADFSQRFAEQVELIPFSTCHYWTGRLNDAGYGVVSVGKRDIGAHRVSYEIHRGPIPQIDGKTAHILHSCDNPMCVNPDHLRPGTHLENIADKVQRGRQYRGERHHARKLSDEAVRRLCLDIAAGEGTGTLAAKYGVAPSRIATIRHGGAFADVMARCGVKPATGRSDRRVSDDCAVEIYAAARAGGSYKDLARRFGVKPSFIADIKRGATYASVTGHRR